MNKPDHALTLVADMAIAVMYGGKRVENRTWPTSFRGPLYLHVSSKYPLDKKYRDELRESGAQVDKLEGHLVATMRIVDCTKDTPRGQEEWARDGLWHFILKDVRVLRAPIPMKGALNIWKIRMT